MASPFDFDLVNHLAISGLAEAPPPEIPLPAALPLFATGLGGLGLFGWRGKRRAKTVA
jgi:hypothetical protein